jgi:hypothetical protein
MESYASTRLYDTWAYTGGPWLCGAIFGIHREREGRRALSTWLLCSAPFSFLSLAKRNHKAFGTTFIQTALVTVFNLVICKEGVFLLAFALSGSPCVTEFFSVGVCVVVLGWGWSLDQAISGFIFFSLSEGRVLSLGCSHSLSRQILPPLWFLIFLSPPIRAIRALPLFKRQAFASWFNFCNSSLMKKSLGFILGLSLYQFDLTPSLSLFGGYISSIWPDLLHMIQSGLVTLHWKKLFSICKWRRRHSGLVFGWSALISMRVLFF